MGIQLSKDTPIHRIKEEQAESFCTSPPVSSLNDDCSTTYSRIFFNLFSAADMDFPMA